MRAQSAMELMLLTSVMFFIFMGALLFGGYHLAASKRESEQSQIAEVAEFMESEIGIALASEPGYARDFTLPTSLGGARYEILVEEQPDFTEIIVRFVNYTYEFERTILVPSAVQGMVNMSPSVPEVLVSIRTYPDQVLIGEGVPPPPPPPPPPPSIPPWVSKPRFFPAAPRTIDDIRANTTVTDIDLDVLTVYFEWRVNGILVYRQVFAGLANGSVVNATLGWNNFTGGQVVNASVNASDGANVSERNSSIVVPSSVYSSLNFTSFCSGFTFDHTYQTAACNITLSLPNISGTYRHNISDAGPWPFVWTNLSWNGPVYLQLAVSGDAVTWTPWNGSIPIPGFFNRSGSLLLLPFDNSTLGHDLEEPLDATGVTFDPGGEFSFGANISTRDSLNRNVTLYYNATGNFNPYEGAISLWVKPYWASTDVSRHILVHAPGNYSSNDSRVWLQALNRRLFLQVSNLTHHFSCGTDAAGAGFTWGANSMFHVAASWNASLGNCSFYINGLQYSDYSENLGLGLRLGTPGTVLIVGTGEPGAVNEGLQANATLDELHIFGYRAPLWELYPTGYNLSGQAIVADNLRYLQWRAIFRTADNSSAPQLRQVRANYTIP